MSWSSSKQRKVRLSGAAVRFLPAPEPLLSVCFLERSPRIEAPRWRRRIGSSIANYTGFDHGAEPRFRPVRSTYEVQILT